MPIFSKQLVVLVKEAYVLQKLTQNQKNNTNAEKKSCGE